MGHHEEPISTIANGNGAGNLQHSRHHQWRHYRVAGVIALYLILALLSFMLLERRGNDYLDRALLKATASYGLARGLNGIVTVIKESSVSAGVVVGGTIAIGQILDPVNDLIERFSWVMMVSIVSLGTQKLLMAIGLKAGILLFVAALPCALIGQRSGDIRRLGYKLFLLAIVVQVALPVMTSIGSMVSAGYLQERYEQAENALALTQKIMQEEYDLDSDSTWLEKLNPRKLLIKMRTQAADLTEHVVELIVIFSFETVVLPLVTLWGLLQVVNTATGRR